MNYKKFRELYISALDFQSATQFSAEKSAPRIIWELAHGGVLTARRALAMTQAEFSAAYSIPKRSIENWEAGSRKPPEYVTLLLMYAAYNDVMA